MSDSKKVVKKQKLVVVTTESPPETTTDNKQLFEDKRLPATLGRMVTLRKSTMPMGEGYGGRLKPIEGRVLLSSTATSAAATALASVIKLTPQSATEFSAYLSLYDECKVTAIDVLYSVAANGGPLSQNIECGIAYDPINNGAYTSAPGVLLASQHKFVKGAVGDSNTNMQIPKVFNADGHFKFHIEVAKGATALTNATDGPLFVGGQWFETGDSDTTAIVGYLKIYIPAQGTGVTTIFDYHIIYHCMFRSRT